MLHACRPNVARKCSLYLKGSAGRGYAVDRKRWRCMDREKYFSKTYYLQGHMTPAKEQQQDPLNRRLGGPQSRSERLNKLWGRCA